MNNPPPGWYPDPGRQGYRRYWNGSAWTDQVAAAARPKPRGWFARHPVLTSVGAVFAVLVVLGALAPDEPPTSPADQDEAAGVVPPELPVAETSPTPTPTPTPTATQSASATKSPQPTPAPLAKTAAPAPTTYAVSHVVDGDTLELANGETVRLVGIDAPEAGECGYRKATERLTLLTRGERVRLGESDEDRDRYGRLLRYVDVGRTDAGLQLIKEGLAIARYDSRDGYGRHPREDRYVAADDASANLTCEKPKTFVAPPAQPAQNCEPGYSPCVPLYPPDLDCGDLNGPYSVSGSDPHGLDRDRDGVGCESG